MPPSTLVRTGLLIVIATILLPLGANHWLKTRKFTPLEMPVSLAPSVTHIAQFETNIRGDYAVQFEADYELAVAAKNSCRGTAWNDVHWKLFRLTGRHSQKREFWASNFTTRPEEIVWGFHAPSGNYQLEWEVSPTAGCLDALRPSLSIVFQPGFDYEQANQLLDCVCLVVGGAGVVLILRGIGAPLRRRLFAAKALRMLPEFTPRTPVHLRRMESLAPIPPVTQLGNFPIAWTCVLGVLLFTYSSFNASDYEGLLADIPVQSAPWAQKSPWPETETISVYLGPDERYYVNSKAVEAADLQTKLREALGTRAVWTVYFESDSSVPFAKAAYAIDAIRSAGGKLIWITPKVREELNREAASQSPKHF